MDKFNRKIGKKWPSNKAEKEIKAYRAKRTDGIHSAIFGRDAIDEILKDEKCHGIKLELAIDEDGTEKIIVSGVDANGAKISGSDVNASMTCPPFCNN